MRKVCGILLALLVTPVLADEPSCPTSLPPAVEARLLPILEATRDALRTDKWDTHSYEAKLDALLAARDSVSVETLVALLDYPISASYSEAISCHLSVGGPRTLRLLHLYQRCDIRPTRSPVARKHPSILRSQTIAEWETSGGKGSCDAD